MCQILCLRQDHDVPATRTLVDRLQNRLRQLLTGTVACQTTTLQLIGCMGQQAEGDNLCLIIELLIQKLGSPSSALRSLAFSEV